MKPVHGSLRRVQVPLRPKEYKAFRRAARRENLSLQDALRQAALAWARERGEASSPLDAMVGRLEGPEDASVDEDADYEED